MNNDFIEKAVKTENKDFSGMMNRITPQSVRLLHGAIGASTEANELLDAMKKHIFYGKSLDVVNVKEEIGDILYYCAILLDELNTDFDTVSTKVIEKLAVRYPDEFTLNNAVNRNLVEERKALENE